MNRLVNKLSRVSDAWVLALAVTVGAIVRFVGLSKSSIWHDEGYTMMLAPQSVADIISRTARDVHPPLYYLKLHFWMELFGTSEASARSLSVVFMLGVIVVGFLLVRELFGRPAARLSAIFLALGPFLVRYSQEARMYGMAAFLAILATYCLVMATKTNSWRWWGPYAVTIAAGLYTHYYIVFVVVLHWAYMTFLRKPKWGLSLKNWWLANILAFGLFLPWVPSAIRQFTRVQGGFWIPKPTILTMPSTVAQFLTFTDLGVVAQLIRIAIFLGFLGMVAWFSIKKEFFPKGALMAGLTFLAPLLVLALSLKRPIYVDRYFVFAAAGFYMLLAILIYVMKPWRDHRPLRILSIITTLLVFGIGIRNVYAQGTHNMRAVGQYVNANFQPDDEIVSGELYTYFDFSYYNRTGTTTKLLAANGVNGFGETSLLYDKASMLLVHDYDQIKPANSRVWVIGKPGDNGDFKVPNTWVMINEFQASGSKTVLYRVQ